MFINEHKKHKIKHACDKLEVNNAKDGTLKLL